MNFYFNFFLNKSFILFLMGMIPLYTNLNWCIVFCVILCCQLEGYEDALDL